MHLAQGLDTAHLFRHYWRRVATVQRDKLIGFWPLWERAGSTAVDYSPAGNDGSYSGATLASGTFKNGRGAPLFDAASSYVNIYSAALAAAFDPELLTVMAWFKVRALSVWTDSVWRLAVRLFVDSDNNAYLAKRGTEDNKVESQYRAGGTAKFNAVEVTPHTDWACMAMTVSVAEDRVRHYYNSTLENEQSGLGTWVGSLGATTTVIGAASTTPAGVFDGNLAMVALWAAELSSDMVAFLSKAP